MDDDRINDGGSYTLVVPEGKWRYLNTDSNFKCDCPIRKKAIQLMQSHGGNDSAITVRNNKGRAEIARWRMYDDIPPGTPRTPDFVSEKVNRPNGERMA